jgi:hypothetical protein
MAATYQLRRFLNHNIGGNRPSIAHIKIVSDSSLSGTSQVCGSSFPLGWSRFFAVVIGNGVQRTNEAGPARWRLKEVANGGGL